MIIGDQQAYKNYDFAADKDKGYFDIDNPINDHKDNTGVTKLPLSAPARYGGIRVNLRNSQNWKKVVSPLLLVLFIALSLLTLINCVCLQNMKDNGLLEKLLVNGSKE